VFGIAKVILFWNMDIKDKNDFTPNDEVDSLVWLTLDAAIHQLTYEGEKILLSHQAL
jgi:hypothetical protein